MISLITSVRWSAALLILPFALAYGPDVGRGFVKDDFAWITYGRVGDLESLRAVLLGNVGFYRPVVSLTFGLNHALFNTSSLGFGLTNLALALACAGGVYALARRLALSPGPALLAAALWAFNFHGINMAILWLSGRTSLLLTLFSILAAIAILKRRPAWVFIWTLLALGSKEEAMALPLICAFWAAAPHDRAPALPLSRRLFDALRATWPSVVALAIYIALRIQSGAFTPESAPAYYRFTFDVPTILDNIGEYADRSMTVSVLALVLLGVSLRRAPQWSAIRRGVVDRGLVWLVGAFALTVWLPVRSSLYAVFPSVGAVLIAAALAESMIARADAARLRTVALAASMLPFLLLPIYWARNDRWVELADLSSATTEAIAAHAGGIEEGTLIELRDDRSARANFGTAFGNLYPEAARLFFGDRYQIWIDPPTPEHVAGGLTRPSTPVGASFQLQHGRVVRVQ